MNLWPRASSKSDTRSTFAIRYVNVLIDCLDFCQYGGESWPNFLWEFYLAFDAGEYCRQPYEDPVETCARPRTAELVAEQHSR